MPELSHIDPRSAALPVMDVDKRVGNPDEIAGLVAYERRVRLHDGLQPDD